MILKALIRYFILNQCVEVAFDHIRRNFTIPDEKTKAVIFEIYRIYREVQNREGVDIGSFDDFYGELMRVYLGSGMGTDVYRYVVIQLEMLRERHPGI